MNEAIYRKVVVKVGTNVITNDRGELDLQILDLLVRQLAELRRLGVEILLVSSGAVGAGRALVRLPSNVSPVASRQVLSSTGQVRLINTYADLFGQKGITVAQILVTKSDFRDRLHYLNIRTCLTSLLEHDIIPIVNENDAVSVTELMFTDNDELSGMIASMMQVDAYIILSHVNGLFDMSNDKTDPQLISRIDIATEHFHQYIKPGKSEFGRGGMLTKCHIAHKLARFGITVHITNGRKPDILLDILGGKEAGTTFVAQKPVHGRKRWIAHSEGLEKGAVTINSGAESALRSTARANSLLPVGIVSVIGTFFKGDIIKICSENGNAIGYGMAQYGSEQTRKLLGKKGEKPLIHYDYLYLEV